MNFKQKFILVLYACVIILLCLFFLPWKIDNRFVGYHPLWFYSPIRDDWGRAVAKKADIDSIRLFVNIFVPTIILGVIFIVPFGNKAKTKIESAKREAGGYKVNCHKGFFRLTWVLSIVNGVIFQLTMNEYGFEYPDVIIFHLALGFVLTWLVYFAIYFVIAGFKAKPEASKENKE